MIKKDIATNTWYVRFYYQGKDIRKKGFKTKADALDFENEKRAELKGFVGSTTSISKLLELYLNKRKTRIKTSTFEKDERILNKYVKPYFKTTTQINSYSITEWKTNLLNNNFKEHYVNQVIKCFRAFLVYISTLTKIDNRAIEELDIVKLYEIKEEMQIWSVDEFNQFINVVDDPFYKTLFETLFWSGLRISELRALTKKDIIGNELIINKRLESKSKVKGITTLKTQASNRKVLMPDAIIKKIKAIESDGLIFPVSETQIRRVLDGYIKKSGVKHIRLHDFRHSHASYLFSINMNVKMISQRLGHSSVSITLDTYVHLLPNEQQQIIDAINKVL